MESIHVPQDIRDIIRRLQAHHFEAWVVGGCVRDALLGASPKDWDIATNATPEALQKLFPSIELVGKAFGVSLLKTPKRMVEIATFREDGPYRDKRRPAYVTFSSAQKDALRRDFTINAIYYDPIQKTFFDPTEGRRDLARGLIRFIGDPEIRLQEDLLRMLRAVRFKNRLGFTYHRDTYQALKRHASLIIEIAAERIYTELSLMIRHHNRHQAFLDLFSLGILQKLFPEVEAMAQTPQPPSHHQEGDVLTHTFLVLKNIPEGEEEALYWAAFFHDYAKPKTHVFQDGRWRYPHHDEIVKEMVRPLLQRLKFPKKLQEKILWLLHYKSIFDHFEAMRLSRRLYFYDHPWFPLLWKLEMADIAGSIAANKAEKEKAKSRMQRIWENYHYAHQAKILPSYHPPLLTGKEIMQHLHCEGGPHIKKIKEALSEAQRQKKVTNKEEAVLWLKKEGTKFLLNTQGKS